MQECDRHDENRQEKDRLGFGYESKFSKNNKFSLKKRKNETTFSQAGLDIIHFPKKRVHGTVLLRHPP